MLRGKDFSLNPRPDCFSYMQETKHPVGTYQQDWSCLSFLVLSKGI